MTGVQTCALPISADIGKALILFHGGKGIKLDLLHVTGIIVFTAMNLVIPATGIGAGTLIGVAVIKIAREQTAAGIGNAECAVDKDLQFHIGTALTNIFNFVQR